MKTSGLVNLTLTCYSMFFHLLYIHLFRPFLKYSPTTSPLPSHVSPRKICIQAASSISKLMRVYKRTYGLRQICNIAVYIVHSACTIHLLNLPDKTAKRDIVHGIRHLEEIAEDWLCARRTLSILSVLGRKWKIELPEEASAILTRTDSKYGLFSTSDVPSPKVEVASPPPSFPATPQRQFHVQTPSQVQSQYYIPQDSKPSISSATSTMNYANGHGLTNIINMPPRMPSIVSPAPSPRLNGSMSLPPDTALQLAQPYSQRHNYTVSPHQNSSTQAGSSGTTPSGTLTRQVSPSTMFGGVDALVESQDWWLRDQATLAVEFSNWGGDLGSSISGNGDGSGNGSLSNGNSNGIGDLNGNFLFGNGGNLGDIGGLGDDEWYRG